MDLLNHIGVRCEAGRRSDQRALAAMALFAILAVVTPAATQATDCPTAREPRIPPSEEPAINIEMHKKQLIAYQAGNYNDDIKLVLVGARGYFSADQVTKPAIVLDIDETSLFRGARRGGKRRSRCRPKGSHTQPEVGAPCLSGIGRCGCASSSAEPWDCA